MTLSSSHPYFKEFLSRWSGARVGRAFTLIEVLVTIAVVGLVIAILLPALGSARREGRMVGSMSNLRSISVGIETYQNESRDVFPCVTPGAVYPHACPGLQIGIPYWDVKRNWIWILHGQMPWDQWAPVLRAPGARRDEGSTGTSCGAPASYEYSRCFVGRPELWGTRKLPEPAPYIAGARRADILYPANKALLWDWEQPYLPGAQRFVGRDLAERTPMLFVDAHVDRRRPVDAAAAAINQALPDENPCRLHDTPDGVRGRDY